MIYFILALLILIIIIAYVVVETLMLYLKDKGLKPSKEEISFYVHKVLYPKD